jgi:general secretion pathway protein H
MPIRRAVGVMPALSAAAWAAEPVMARPRRLARGFTLIELLVVLLIGGILASVATLAITRNPHTALLEDGRRLALLFESASEEAQIRTRPVAWEPTADGYRFAVRAGDNWRTLNDELLGPRKWEAAVTGVTIRYGAPGGGGELATRLMFGIESLDPAVVVTLHSDNGDVSVVGTGNGRYGVR